MATVHFENADQAEMPLQLPAVVKPPIEFSPFPAVFFAAYPDESPEKRVTIINNAETPLFVQLGEFPQGHYEVALVAVEPGKTYELRVKVRPGLPLGRYTERIILHTNRPQKARLQVAANLFVKPNFYAFPETVNFGSINLETLHRKPQLLELLTQTTIVTSRFAPFEVVSVETDLLFLKISQTPVNGPTDSLRLNVGLTREKLQKGRISGNLRIRPTDPTLPELIIPVTGEIN
jgi:hypothetical protein